LIRRHYLATRADSSILLEKASRAPVDAVMIDMEDGVPEGEKEPARATARAALRDLDWGNRFRIIRTNPVGSQDGKDDLAMVDAGPDGFILAMVRGADDVRAADAIVTDAESAAGVPAGTTKLYVMIEQAPALLTAYDIFRASPRMAGFIFGPADLTVDVGLDSVSEDGYRLNLTFLEMAASMASLAGAAAGIQRVGVSLGGRLDNPQSQIDGYRKMFGLGYDGMLIVTPRAAALVETAMRPEEGALAFAQGAIAAYHEGLEKQGTSVTAYKGQVLEKPFLLMAEQIIRRAEKAVA
jgi:citrate lyase subunit beta / citryl-CoA lyase